MIDKRASRGTALLVTRLSSGQDLYDEHLSLLTNRTLRQRMPGEFLVPLSIVLLEVTAGLVEWHSQQLTAQSKLSPAATIGQETVMANALKALWQNVHSYRDLRIEP
jgi:hypothetical protein